MAFPARIYPRILLPFSLALVLAGGAGWWTASTLVSHLLLERQQALVERALHTLSQGNLPLSPELLQRLGAMLDLGLYLVPRTSRSDAPPPLPEPLGQAVKGLLEGRAGAAERGLIRLDGVAHTLSVHPLADALDPRVRAVAAAAPAGEIQRAGRRIALQFGGGVALGVLLLAWLAHRIARGLTEPISRLAALAAQLARGDLSSRAAAGGPLELAELATALNEMAGHIERAQRRQLERNRLSTLGEMAARVAHEIRNPLTAIKLNVQLLHEQLADSDAGRTTGRLVQEIQRLELVVSSTLMLGKSAECHPLPADLDALVAEVAALLQPQLSHRHLELRLDLGRVPPIPLDADKMKQVVFNLIHNAMAVLPAGGMMRIATRHEAAADRVLLRVEDDGPGIPAELHPRLFRAAAAQRPDGLGIGLLLCREVVEQHGGRIEALPAGDLGGACFDVRLPGAGAGAGAAPGACSEARP